MPYSFSNSYYHCVFSTKERRKLITPYLQTRLFPYTGGIAREHRIKLLAVGGMPDHVHFLLSLSATMPISKAIQLIKAGASKWIHDTFPKHIEFAWQKGYDAFSIAISGVGRTRKYIENQEKHHTARDFKKEFVDFLGKNGIEYDKRYVF